MRNLPTCHGCDRGSDLISCWGQLWCPDCLAREGKAAAGIFDERVWPETERLCDSGFNFQSWDNHNPGLAEIYGPVGGREDYIPNRDESDLRPYERAWNTHVQDSQVPEGGLIHPRAADELEAWYGL